jgi:dTDP-4-dehydrorhamnose 3,5-epimerase
MIEGVIIKPLKIFRDERGQVMHMLRCDDPLFKGFGEIYFSVVNVGVVKGWKRHKEMVQSFAVPKGDMKLVIYDDRPKSPSKGEIQVIEFGENNYQLVRLPPMVWYSFSPIGGVPAMVANCANIPFSPQESEQIDLDDTRVPYRW